MNKIKYLISMCFVVVFICCMSSDLKAEETEIDTSVFEYEENEDGTIFISDYNGTDETVIIPAEIDGKTVTGIGVSSFAQCKTVKHLIISEGIVDILDNGFDGTFFSCKNLETVSLPSTLKTIGRGAFSVCDKLQEINLPAGLISIGDTAFYKCYKLNNVILPDGLINIGSSAFAYCSSIEKLIVPDSVTQIGDRAFEECHKLQEFNLPDGLVSVGEGAFYSCENLETVSLPTTLKTIGNNAFHHCRRLTNIAIPSGVTSIGKWAFFGCVSLKKLIIPDSVIQIGEEAFNLSYDSRIPIIYGNPDAYIKTYCDADHYIKFSCINHPNVVIDPAVAPNCKYGGRTQGSHCTVCGTVVIEQQYIRPNGQHTWDDGVIDFMPNARRNGRKRYTCKVCGQDKFETITVPKKGNILTNSNVTYKVTNSGRNRSTVEFTAMQKSETNITIPNTVKIAGITYKVTSIAKNAFKNNKNLKRITINGNVTKINANAFSGCTNLKTIKIKSKNLKSVGKNAFKGISPKAKIKVPSEYLEEYKKLLAKKGQKSSVKITK